MKTVKYSGPHEGIIWTDLDKTQILLPIDEEVEISDAQFTNMAGSMEDDGGPMIEIA